MVEIFWVYIEDIDKILNYSEDFNLDNSFLNNMKKIKDILQSLMPFVD